MRPPAFWDNDPARPGLWARVLAPVGALYAAATARRLSGGDPYQAKVPVICVGNINAGGTGKTPTVIWLLDHLGEGTHVVTRGHGGRLKGPVRVDPARHDADEVGDEPLLLAAFAPVWVSRDRADGIRAAEDAGARFVVMDDGHQNPSVRKDLTLVTVDAHKGFGNGRCIPAGPLREPVGKGLARGDVLLSVGADPDQNRFASTWKGEIELPHVRGRLAPLPTGMPWKGMPVLAFAGIGDPQRVFRTLRDLGALVVRGEALDDHQPLTPRLMERLEAEARAANAQLVTTEKDAVRLPDAFRAKVITLPVRLQIDEPASIMNALKQLQD